LAGFLGAALLFGQAGGFRLTRGFGLAGFFGPAGGLRLAGLLGAALLFGQAGGFRLTRGLRLAGFFGTALLFGQAGGLRLAGLLGLALFFGQTGFLGLAAGLFFSLAGFLGPTCLFCPLFLGPLFCGKVRRVTAGKIPPAFYAGTTRQAKDKNHGAYKGCASDRML
jgi:hypothetical protein